MGAANLSLRLEGLMQAWGTNEGKFMMRRTASAPTKSGVLGMLCSALGVKREDASNEWLPRLSALRMAVRIDRPGTRWWDYHTVGAGLRMDIAEKIGKTKPGAMLTRREYLCDASFLVVLGSEGRDSTLVDELNVALHNPVWPLFLGRKSCPPGRPILQEHDEIKDLHIFEALRAIPWQPRYKGEAPPKELKCLLEWRSGDAPEAPVSAEVWHDVPISFAPPGFEPRLVEPSKLLVGRDVPVSTTPLQGKARAALRPRADYTNSAYKKARAERLESDSHLCVFCKQPGTTVQHITYQRAGGAETQGDLRTLCRLCHDAVTMLEYGHGMGMERINPEDPSWREGIIAKRQEILRHRSRANRQRHLSRSANEED